MIKHPHYVIAVHDLEASATFYHEKLGFSVREMAEGWRFLHRDNCLIMAGECPEALPASELGDHSYFAYLEVDSVEALNDLYESISEKGVHLVKKLRNESWGMREFGIRTIDGHRIMFGCEVAT